MPRLLTLTFNLVLMLGALALAACGRPAWAQEQARTDAPRTLADWTAQLEEGTRVEKLEAIHELAALRGRAARAVPQLTDALESSDPEVQERAAMALGAIGPAAADAANPLAKLLKAPQATVRAYAADSLGRIGNATDQVVSGLVEAVVDEEIVVRRQARDALRQLNAPSETTLPLMMKLLEESEPSEVMPALQYFADAGDEAVPALIDALQHPKASYWACLVLQDLGVEAKQATPHVLKVLEHPDPEYRMQAVLALAEMGADASRVLERLVEQVQNEDSPAVRHASIYALGRIAKGNAKAAPPVIEALQNEFKSQDSLAQVISAWGLLRIAPDDEQLRSRAYKRIVQGLESEDLAERRAAIRAMVELDPEHAPPAEGVEALVKAAQDVDPTVIERVISGLADRGKEVLPRLETGLENDTLRPYTLEVIQRMGEEAAPLAPRLVALLKEQKDPELMRETQFALGAIRAAAAAAVPHLIQNLDSEHEQVRYSACYALGKIGPAAASSAERLKAQLDAEDPFLRLASVWALLRVEPTEANRQAAVPLLVDLLEDPRDLIRVEAAATLGDIQDKRAISALKKATQDPSRAVRDAAQKALEKDEG